MKWTDVDSGRTVRTMSLAIMMGVAGSIAACSTASSLPPIQTAERVDLERFMGDWYVISSIPTWIERDAYNAVESYELGEDGRIETVFTFRQGSFEGKEKKYQPTGFVRDSESNAVWGMQFIWPIKADYRIVYLADDYSRTIIGRNKRDLAWIMARTPEIPADQYEAMVAILEREGYDPALLRKVPQRHE